MNSLVSMIKRNTKLFFLDKGLFFCSLITPMILLVLYITFLARVFKESFLESMPNGFTLSDSIINAVVGGQLLASLLAVSCITVAFTANMLMVQDKINGARKDILLTPIKKSTLAFSYYLSTLFSTLIICLVATAICFIYLAIVGFYMSFVDCLLIFCDVLLLTMLGTALSSIVNHFLSSQGQVSAVGTIVSAMYGFICGAYMPIASFSSGLQNVLMFLPSTYATSLLKTHAMNGVLNEMSNQGVPNEVIHSINDSIDGNLYFFGTEVSMQAKFLILIGAVILFVGIYILINYLNFKRKSKKAK